MKKNRTIRALALAGLFAGAAVTLPGQSVDAAGFIDLDFENTPSVIGIGVGMLPD